MTNVEDPYLWLEDVEGPKALDWVRERNKIAQSALEADDGFETLRTDLLAILDSEERIPMVAKRGEHFYNFWQDAKNPRGLWRRTTLDDYRNARPAWETVLDIDELNRVEGENWVWHGPTFLKPQRADEPWARCLISLSRGGSDADVTREFDVTTCAFVEDGFFRPEAKGALSWIDHDRVFAFTDFGPGSLTGSGYPRIVKEWRRGTSLDEATVVYEGLPSDMYIAAGHDQTRGFARDFVSRSIAFYSNELYLRNTDGTLTKIDVPDSAEAAPHREWLLVTLRDPWEVEDQTYPPGALLVARFDEFMEGARSFDVLFTPDDRSSLLAASWTKNHLVRTVLRDVKNEVAVLTPTVEGWREEKLQGAPDIGTVVVWAVDDEESDDYFMTTTDYLTPHRLWIGTIGQEPEVLKSMPAFFDAEGLQVTQHFATSKDGTKVPYFMISRSDADTRGPVPALLHGYGGFEVSMIPAYIATTGRAWLSEGGVYIDANIRGGGEYGPRWHQAALRENRHRAYEDFAAVAEDVIARGVTTSGQLGVIGGSNGGLLVGNMLTRYPHLFGAVVCQVPLLDMQRYHKLLAGASWVAEYGDPDDPNDWAFVETFSPYHNVKSDGAYPPVLFTTSTRDDRVHPGHARKMTARMEEQGHDVLYYENIEGGHGGAADNKQLAFMYGLEYTFLKRLFG